MNFRGLCRFLTLSAALYAAASGFSVAGSFGQFSEIVISQDARPTNILVTDTGELWFTDLAAEKIGRITPTHEITEYTVPTKPANVRGLAIGPDGNVWFAEFIGGKIGRITPDGAIREFALGACRYPADIISGKGSALWFNLESSKRTIAPFPAGCPDYAAIGRITTAGTVTEFPIHDRIGAIATKSDGSLWFTHRGAIGEITPDGTIRMFPLAKFKGASEVLFAPDGSLWFADFLSASIGQIDTSGNVRLLRTFQLKGRPGSMAVDHHGTAWFTDPDTNSIGWITPHGDTREIELPARNSYPAEVTIGSDGAVWLTEYNAGKIGRFVPATPYVFPLKAGLFTLAIPSGIYQRQTGVRPQFSEFGFYDGTSASPLFVLGEGSGSYDLNTFTKTCLNGRLAWEIDDGDSGTVVVGEPGSWVAVSWSGLSGDRLSAVRTIVSSMSVNFGPKC